MPKLFFPAFQSTTRTMRHSISNKVGVVPTKAGAEHWDEPNCIKEAASDCLRATPYWSAFLSFAAG
jgi:hypothetical protein